MPGSPVQGRLASTLPVSGKRQRSQRCRGSASLPLGLLPVDGDYRAHTTGFSGTRLCPVAGPRH